MSELEERVRHLEEELERALDMISDLDWGMLRIWPDGSIGSLAEGVVVRDLEARE